MLKRMNLARWFMLINGLAWIYFWARVWHLMMPWDPQGKGHTHGRAYLWMLIGHHALEWGSESRLMIGIALAQIPVLLPLRLIFNCFRLYGDFLGINGDAW